MRVKETREKETVAKVTGAKETGLKDMGEKKTGAKETGEKETGAKETGAKATGGKTTGTKASGAKTPGAQDSQETGGKGDKLVGERETDNILPGYTTAGQNATEGIRHKRYSEVVIDGMKKRARVFVEGLIVRKTDRALTKADEKNRGYHREGEKSWVRTMGVLF